MKTRIFPHALIIITDDETSLEPEFLKLNAKINHLSILDDGQSVTIKTVKYVGKRITAKESKTFSPSMMPGLISYLYTELRHASDSGLVIYNHTQSLFHLLQIPLQKSSLPVALWINDTNTISFNWKQQHFVSGAIARFCFSPETKKLWQSTLVYDCDVIKPKELGPFLKACTKRFDIPATPKSMRSKEHKCLLLSYFAPPSETVAVHRIAYWKENLPKIAVEFGHKMSVDVMTANNSYKSRDNVLYVPDTAEVNCSEEKTHEFIKTLENTRVNYFAAYWASHVRNWLLENPGFKFDSVIMSGNPFYYFELAETFREVWGAKVILDFRDPFANNPRFKFTEAHKKLVCDLEDEYLANSDYALSVNQYCLEALRLPKKSMGLVVANGYDERIVEKAKPLPLRKKDKKTTFVYTGSFYADRDPELFLKGLNAETQKLIHIGRVAKTDEQLDQYPAMERYGLMPYEDVVKYCKSMSAGIIFTSGKLFEQTTKIFDYIAADIDIIIVTEGRVKTGELHRITRDMTGVYWVKNKSKDIAEFLKNYKTSKNKRKNRISFSRYEQTKKLYDVLMDTLD